MKPSKHLLLFLLLLFAGLAHTQEIQPLFNYWQYYEARSNVLYHEFVNTGISQLNEREKQVAGLGTKKDWVNRKNEIRGKLLKIVGPFPPKTPLNAKITGTVKADGFRVEKLVYESMPGFYVTAALFLPDGLQEKAPAVLYCSGHTYESFRSKVYQHMIINLVKKGFIVLAFDPVGQGERLQYLDEAGTGPRFRTPTYEHSYPGNQCFISGNSLAKYMIWDGIRSIDYLVSRPEVDTTRLGITGRSGGGTQSTYIAAFDNRINVSAPECYITSFNYLLKSIGPQDAEQDLPGLLEHGLDLADLLEVRIPRPTLIISTTNDFFSIQGARETFREAKRAYAIWGKEENISMVEDDAPHQSTKKNRKALYFFLQKHFNLPLDTADLDVTLFDKKDLQVTETGQVQTSLGGETIFSLNRKESEVLLKALNTRREEDEIGEEKLKSWIAESTGYEVPGKADDPVFSGREVFDEYVVEKYLLQGGGSYKLPVLVMVPREYINSKAAILLNPDGKEMEVSEGSLGRWLMEQGYHVVLPDIGGVGELNPTDQVTDEFIDHSMYRHWYAGILTGKTPVGLKMRDISLLVQFIEKNLSVSGQNIDGIARGILANDLLHAAAGLDLFERIALIDPLVSFRSLVMNRNYRPQYAEATVPGVLLYYDLPDLAAGLAPRKLLMIDIRNQDGDMIDQIENNEDIIVIKRSFEEKKAGQHLEIKTSTNNTYEELFGNWME